MGGGPAGLATAIELAARGLAALVVERSDYNDVRIGEHVQPPAVLQLRALSSRLKLPLGLHFACGGVEAYWGSSEPNYTDYCFHPAQHGLSLLRPQFDADLAAACDLSGATVLRGATLKCAQKQETGWDVDIVVRGRTQGFSVSLIVDATGRSVAFSRRQGAKVYAHDRQMAIVTFEDDANNGASTRSLIETAEIGWWYRSPIGPARSICMLITDSDLVPRGARPNLYAWWLDQLSRTTELACRYRGSGSDRLFVRSARSQCVRPPYGKDWLAVGDAATAFDPLASQGIAKALDHATRAAASIAASLSGDPFSLRRFALELDQEYASYRSTRASYYRMEMRWPQSAFWSRRHGSISNLNC
jgi:flavin-dependent dehydrogenase